MSLPLQRSIDDVAEVPGIVTTARAPAAAHLSVVPTEAPLSPQQVAEVEALLTVAPLCRWPSTPPTVAPIAPSARRNLRLVITVGVLATAAFLLWFLNADLRGGSWLYWPLTAALLYKIVLWVYEWSLYWNMEPQAAAPAGPTPTVDVFTTWCPGEPKDMIVRSLKAIGAMRHPHRAHLCDEGNDPVLREICRRLGVVHFTRAIKRGAKAGNINAALARTLGEFCVILDPDHEPSPDFLDRVIPHFADPEVGFVQAVQAYHNQGESLIARGAAEQTYQLSGPLMLGMNQQGIVPAFGSNCAFRRAALDSIGGHAIGLAEDMHTAMRLHAGGWRSIYLPEILTRGLVPNTLSAYYKQQMKWSCGTFDLLIQTYFRIFRRLTGAQRLQYAMNAVFYAGGVVGLINISVPVLCLVLGIAAWSVGLEEFLSWYMPVLLSAALIRQSAQRWLLEPSERGFHLVGGVLRAGTWWVHLSGMVCSLLRVKIPYIPTPKDDGESDAWRVATPNLIAALVSAAAAVYGLLTPWHDFTLVMVALALVNAVQLTGVSLMGQQRTMRRIAERAASLPVASAILGAVDGAGDRLRSGYALMLGGLRERAVPAALATMVAVVGLHAADQETMAQDKRATASLVDARGNRGFLLGMYHPEHDRGRPAAVTAQVERSLGVDMRLVSTYQAWGPQSLAQFPEPLLRQAWSRGGVPLIVWEPWVQDLPAASGDPNLSNNRRVLAAIAEGTFDDYILAYAMRLRDLGGPVMMSFAHEVDNEAYHWSAKGGNSAADFVAAWRHVVTLFRAIGATNVVWVYHPWSPAAVTAYYPGADYVDWVGLTMLNYGSAGRDGNWHSFAALYEAYRRQVRTLEKPVLLAEFGTTAFGGDPAAWIADSLASIATRYPEIRGLSFFHSQDDRNWATAWRPSGQVADAIDWTVGLAADAVAPVVAALAREPFNGAQTAGSQQASAGRR